jgi:hypothetical protein
MKNIILLTGYGEVEFKKRGLDETLRCCYRCKRTEQDQSVVIVKEELLLQPIRLLPLSVEIMDSDLIAKFLLCIECYLLYSSPSGKNFSIPAEVLEREGLGIKRR